MPISFEQIVPPGTYLTTSYVLLYTAPSTAKKVIIKELSLHNNDAQERTPYIRIVGNGQTPGDEHNIKSPPISAGADYPIAAFIVLMPGDTIYAKADAASVVTILANGIEQT